MTPDDAARAAYVARALATAPPLTVTQARRIWDLLDPTPPTRRPYVPPRVAVHYDADDRCLYLGSAVTALLRHVQLVYVTRTEQLPEPDTYGLRPVFGRDPRPMIDYLIAHDDLGWVMPVQHLDSNAEALPQMSRAPWEPRP